MEIWLADCHALDVVRVHLPQARFLVRKPSSGGALAFNDQVVVFQWPGNRSRLVRVMSVDQKHPVQLEQDCELKENVRG